MDSTIFVNHTFISTNFGFSQKCSFVNKKKMIRKNTNHNPSWGIGGTS